VAMIRVEPVRVQVRADWFDGRPREITWNSQRVPVTGRSFAAGAYNRRCD